MYKRDMTKEEARKYIRELCGPPRRDLEGTEYDQIRTLLSLADPHNVSNNQHAECSEYLIAGIKYEVVDWPGCARPIISEIGEYEDDE